MNILNYLENISGLHKHEIDDRGGHCAPKNKKSRKKQINLSAGFNKCIVNLPDGRCVTIKEDGDVSISTKSPKKRSKSHEPSYASSTVPMTVSTLTSIL